MKTEIKQLMLEILLIRARYSDQNIEEVGNLFKNGDSKELHDIRNLFSIIENLKPKSASKRIASTIHPVEAKRSFISSLRLSRSTVGKKRIADIAKKLQIDTYRSDATQLVNKIANILDDMNDDQLSDFLKNYRTKPIADKGYVGLADFLIHSNDKETDK